MSQTDLFGDAAAADLIDHLGDMPAEEIAHRWPQRLAELVDISTATLQRQGVTSDLARTHASVVVAAIAHFCGGRMLYLPTDEKLQIALRDRRIWQERDEYSPDQLSSRYDLSVIQIYKILSEQRKLYVGRVQRRLFGEDE